MSEPKRWDLWEVILEETDSTWVRWEDYARLKAEVERIRKFNDEALAHIAKEERKSRERLDMEQAENARLKAEVERLTKGGDRLADLFETTIWWEKIKKGKQP
jgi:hypothetical protein